MARLLAVHLTAIAVLAGVTAFALRSVGEALPDANRWLVMALTSVYGGCWLALVVLRLLRPRPEGLRRYNRALALGGSLVIATNSFLIGPYASERLQLISILYQMGAVTMQVMGSIRRPAGPSWSSLEPLIIPASIAIFYVVHWSPISPALIVFAMAYGLVAISLARILQRSVDRAYAGRAAAEQARDAKARFLASASHDLGQPLQAARLYLDQALRGRTKAAREQAGQKAAWALETTERLLDRILDHLRLEAEAVEPTLEPTPLGPLIASVAELNEPAARLAGVELVALPTGRSAFVDAALVQRALGNLVGNSLRHASAKRVLIGARRRRDRVRLWVIDDGVGVAAGDADRLFVDYVQGARGPGDIRGGFGLGLASARRIAELMGGAAGHEPRWTRGAAFWLELPATAPKAA